MLSRTRGRGGPLSQVPRWVWPLLVLGVLLGRRWRRRSMDSALLPDYQSSYQPPSYPSYPSIDATPAQPQETASAVPEQAPTDEESPGYPMASEVPAASTEDTTAEEPTPAAPDEPAEEPTDAAPAEEMSEDDLAVIEGIGPKISAIFQEAGIKTFKQLAEASVDDLRQVLRDAGIRVADPTTWPEQAALAAAGDWDGLHTLQANLTAGRRTED